jgi:hypothetical protein
VTALSRFPPLADTLEMKMLRYKQVYYAFQSHMNPNLAFVDEKLAQAHDLEAALKALNIEGLPDHDTPEFRAFVFLGEYLQSLPEPVKRAPANESEESALEMALEA